MVGTETARQSSWRLEKQIVNQNFRSGNLTEIKSVYLWFVRTASGETQILEALELCLAVRQSAGGL